MVVETRGQILQGLEGWKKSGTGFCLLLLEVLFAEGISSSGRAGGVWREVVGGRRRGGAGEGVRFLFCRNDFFFAAGKGYHCYATRTAGRLSAKVDGKKNGDTPGMHQDTSLSEKVRIVWVLRHYRNGPLNFRTDWCYVNAWEWLGQGFPQAGEPVGLGVGGRWRRVTIRR